MIDNDIPASPHTHPVINQMDDIALSQMLEQIMARRMRLNAMYVEAKRIRAKETGDKTHALIDKQLTLFHKETIKLDKSIEKLLLSANKIIALQLQLGLDTSDATRLIQILNGDAKT